MNILLHGATNWGSSNFGDVIYADQVARHIARIADRAIVQIAEPSEFVSKWMPSFVAKGISISNADALVYIPGGYFGEGHSSGLLNNLIHFLRFFPLGLRAVWSKVPIAIIGIGAGPINSPLFRLPIKSICSHAEIITVRDHESYVALLGLGILNVAEAFDLILAMDIKSALKPCGKIRALRMRYPNKKMLFVHFNHSEIASDMFASAVVKLMKAHPEYLVITGFDQVFKDAEERMQRFLDRVPDAHVIDYEDPYELVDVLQQCDCVLTCKLHVGVVAAMFGKSVVCAAEHPEKTQRFFNEIGQGERCASLYSADENDVMGMLQRFIDVPIIIPDELYESAMKSWRLLDTFLESIG